MNRLKEPSCVPGERVCDHETNAKEELEWLKRRDALVQAGNIPQ